MSGSMVTPAAQPVHRAATQVKSWYAQQLEAIFTAYDAARQRNARPLLHTEEDIVIFSTHEICIRSAALSPWCAAQQSLLR